MARLSYSAEIANAVCEKLEMGESLVAISRMEGMPSQSAVYEWLEQHSDFAERYARARARQADTLADSILDIADGEGDSDDKRVRIDSRKWLAGKLRPKVYGDKVAVGGDADAPPISMAFRWEQPNGS